MLHLKRTWAALEKEICDSSKYRQYTDQHVRVLEKVTGACSRALGSIDVGEGFKLVSKLSIDVHGFECTC